MNTMDLNMIYEKRKKHFSKIYPSSLHGNHIVLENSNTAGKNPVIKNSMEPVKALNQNTLKAGKQSSKIQNMEDERSFIYNEEVDIIPDKLDFSFNSQNVLSGIIFSEILGKPRCKRRGL